MSDPVTNAEIEDVLSSIRRLVSEDSRNTVRHRVAEPVRMPEPVSKPQAPRAPDRLVLTPSLRVAPDPVEDAHDEIEPEADLEQAEAFSGRADIAELIPQDDAADEDYVEHSDGSEDTSHAFDDDDHDDSDGAYELAGDAEVADDWDGGDSDEAFDFNVSEVPTAGPDAEEDALETDPDRDEDDAPWSNPDSTLYEAAASYDEAVEDLQDGTDADGDYPERDDEEEIAWAADDAAPDSSADVWNNDDSDDTDRSEDQDQADDQAEEQTHEATAEVFEPVVDVSSRLSGKVEALSAAMHSVGEQGWEADGGDTADQAGLPETEPLEWRDADAGSDADEVPAVEAAVVDNDADDTRLFSDDETVLDEAMLRELVADIVRQELQGALGERITRNVRKLVRREINRALSVQDME